MDLRLFLPETILSIGIIVLLCLTLVRRTPSTKTVNTIGLAFSILAAAGTVHSFGYTGFLFESSYRVDLFSQVYKTLILGGLTLTLLLSRSALAYAKGREIESQLFLFTSALGMVLIPSCADLISLFVAMELSSYSLYLLTALRSDRRNAEASVKYLLFGAVASGLFLWGVSLLLPFTGGVGLSRIAQAVSGSPTPVVTTALCLILFPFLFKLSAAPAHFWAPDVYQRASTPITTFISTSSKAAAVALLSRFLMSAGVSGHLAAFLGVLAFVSMTLGNTVALIQKDVKRLLAYSSIAQAGYLLVGLLSGTSEGYATALFYALAYLLMNAAVFLVVIVVAKDKNCDNPVIEDFNGLAERAPKLALLLLLGTLSLAGIPPLAGFTGKWVLFAASMRQGHWFLVLWAVLNSVVSLFYYLTLVKHAYLEKPASPAKLTLPADVLALALVLMALVVGLGVFPNNLLTLAQQAISQAPLS